MSNSGGAANFAGLNAQVAAALSLFLQYVTETNFSHVHLEAPGFQDFNLVFNNGKKIICESKEREKEFSYPDLRGILEKSYHKFDVNRNDEILIICKKVNGQLLEDVRDIQRPAYSNRVEKKFLSKKYSSEIIPLISAVNFWVIPAEFNKKIVYSLFYELIKYWLPEKDIERMIDNILVQKIYNGSALGSTYSRSEFLKEISDSYNEVKQDSVYYNTQFKKIEEQFKEVKNALTNAKDPRWKSRKELAAFSGDLHLMSFALDKLKELSSLELSKWVDLWKLNQSDYFVNKIFSVFLNNMDGEANKSYVLSYFKEHILKIFGYYKSKYFIFDFVKIMSKIINEDTEKKYLTDIFNVLTQLIEHDKNNKLYVKNSPRFSVESEKNEIFELICKIYQSSDSILKGKVFNLIVSSFSFVEDDGGYNSYVPLKAYEIVKEWLIEDFHARISVIVKLMIEQYANYYQKINKNLKFEGWEYSGGISSFWDDSYCLYDRHFLRLILIPAIKKFYNEDNIKGWNFIKKNFITKERFVQKSSPDFLNRAVCEIVFSRYCDKDKLISEEAFSILKEFILSEKGIPKKYDLIYQEAYKSSLEDEKKWDLLDLSIQKYEMPSILIQKMVDDLVRNNFLKAKKQLRSWFNNPKYYNSFLFEQQAIASIKNLLDSDLNFAAELFEALIKTDYVKNEKIGAFISYKVAHLLHDILEKNYAKGLLILRTLELEEKLTVSQQTIYVGSLFNSEGNDDSDVCDLLLKIYFDVVDPLLNKYSNNNEFIKIRISNDRAREMLVEFAARLASKKEIDKALRIIKIFVIDANPNNQSVSIVENEELRTIETVRGRCGWALAKCVILEGREHISEIIDLVEKLMKDKNYNVVNNACPALCQLVKNRLSVLPENNEILFFDDQKVIALQRAKKIEFIAFELLERFSAWPFLVQKKMAPDILYIFGSIGTLNEKEALNLITILARLPLEIVSQFADIFIFFAEFRKSMYKNWKFGVAGLYDDLGSNKYDDKKFKAILFKLIDKLQLNKPEECYQFVRAIESSVQVLKPNSLKKMKITLKYFNLLSNVYSRSTFESIYAAIKNNFEGSGKYKKEWFSLLVKCLAVEKNFHHEQFELSNFEKIEGHSYFYLPQVLSLVYDLMGFDKFFQATEIFLSFECSALHDLDRIADIIKTFSKSRNKKSFESIKKLTDLLFGINQSKYFELKTKIMKKS